MRVPLGLVGQGVGVASFPFLAQLYSEKKFEELNRVLNTTFKGLIFLLLPISALTIAQSVPIVNLVFSHTRMHGLGSLRHGPDSCIFLDWNVRLGRAIHSGSRAFTQRETRSRLR